MSAVYINYYVRMSVIISFLVTYIKIHTASNSEMKGRTECLVYKNAAVYINDYVRMSVIISFLATFFQV